MIMPNHHNHSISRASHIVVWTTRQRYRVKRSPAATDRDPVKTRHIRTGSTRLIPKSSDQEPKQDLLGPDHRGLQAGLRPALLG